MSYILDALRRAEADRERERGQVPGLHTPAAASAVPEGGRRPGRWLPWAGGGLLLLTGVAAGVWWSGAAEAPPAPAALPAPQPSAPAPNVIAAPAPEAPSPTARAAEPVPPLPTATAASSASPYLPAAPVATAPTAPPPTPRAAPPAAPERIPLLSELPEPVRRDMPKLALGGSVYSDDAASRLVIVNGEVLHEGASIGAHLVLEQIRPRELVLRFKGQRFRQPV